LFNPLWYNLRMSEVPSVKERAKGAHPEKVHPSSTKKLIPQAPGQMGAFEQASESQPAPVPVEIVDRIPETERAPWFKAGTRYYRQIPHTRQQYETWGAELPFDMQVQLSARSIKSDQTITPERGFGTVYVLGEVTCVDDKDKSRWVDLNGKGKTVDNTTPSKF